MRRKCHLMLLLVNKFCRRALSLLLSLVLVASTASEPLFALAYELYDGQPSARSNEQVPEQGLISEVVELTPELRDETSPQPEGAPGVSGVLSDNVVVSPEGLEHEGDAINETVELGGDATHALATQAEGQYSSPYNPEYALPTGETDSLVVEDVEGKDGTDLYARWEPVLYTVRFDANGGDAGSAPDDLSVTYDSPYSIPDLTPQRETNDGYVFAGWATDPTASEALVQPGEVCDPRVNPALNLSSAHLGVAVLYAVWVEAPHTVTWDANGSGATVDPAATSGVGVVAAPVPERRGYCFDGWFSEPTGNGSPVVEPNGTVDLDSHDGQTLYAHWTPITYTIAFDANGGDEGSAPASIGATFDSPWETPAAQAGPTRAAQGMVSYELLGWSLSPRASVAAAGVGQLCDPAASGGAWNLSAEQDAVVTLYAVWGVHDATPTYTITFFANGGEGEMQPQVLKRADLGDGQWGSASGTLAACEFTKEDHVPAGWTDDDGTFYQNGQDVEINGDLNLYASWAYNVFSVTWDANGDGAAVNPASTTGSGLVFSPLPVWPGHLFLGWYDVSGNEVAQPGGMVDLASFDGQTLYAHWEADRDAHALSEPLSLYARWEPATYTISFNANGGELAPDLAAVTVQYGQKWQLPSGEPTREGYAFRGWALDPLASEPQFFPGEQESIDLTQTDGATVRLYALWRDEASYTVTWDHNAPVGFRPEVSQVSTTGTGLSVAPTASCEGLVFLGWFDGPGQDAAFAVAEGGLFDLASWAGRRLYGHWKVAADETTLTAEAGSQHYYARWEPVTYSVAFNANGGELTEGLDPMVVQYGSGWRVPDATPTREGSFFVGWALDRHASTAFLDAGEWVTTDLSDSLDSTVTLYAVWTDAESSVSWDPNSPQGYVATVDPAMSTGTGNAVAPTPVCGDRVFAGWYDGPGRDATFVVGAGGILHLPTWDGFTLYAHWDAPEDEYGAPGEAGGHLDVYARWELARYTVAFNANGGVLPEALAPKTVQYGADWHLPVAEPTREGFVFLGWAFDARATEPLLLAGQVNPGPLTSTDGATVTLYAVWSRQQVHTVVWDANGAGATVDPSSTTGAGLAVSPVPVWAGHPFLGWYDGPGAGAVRVAEPGDAVDLSALGDTTLCAHWGGVSDSDTLTAGGDSGLFARWEPVHYTVAFNANGGDEASVPEPVVARFGEGWRVPGATPTREGFVFAGWAFDPGALVALLPADQFTTIDLTGANGATVTLYAVWEETPYTVVWNPNGAGASVSPTTTTGAGMVASPTPVWQRHRFVGWYDGPGSGASLVAAPGAAVDLTALGDAVLYAHWQDDPAVDTHTVSSDTDLYARWEPVSYEVVFDANGGDDASAPEAQSVQYDRPWQVPLQQPVRDGYGFAGWALDSRSHTPLFASGEQVQANLAWGSGSSVVLYAVWDDAPASTVTWDANATDATVSPAFSTGWGVVASPVPVRPNYVFTGWYRGPDAGAALALSPGSPANLANLGTTRLYAHWTPNPDPYVVSGDSDLYARWEPVTYTISFDANGGSGAPAPVRAQYDRPWTLPSATPSREGMSFIGWGLSRDDVIPLSYEPGGEVHDNLTSQAGGTVTLYALWAEEGSTSMLHLTYHAHNGSNDVLRYAVTCAYLGGGVWGTARTKAAANVFSYDDHLFVGWNTEQDGTGTLYLEGEIVEMSEDLDLYAQWTDDVHTVYWDANASDARLDATSTTGSGLAASPVPSRPAHRFLGWFTGPGEGAELAVPMGGMVDLASWDGRTLFAHWEEGDDSGEVGESTALYARWEPVGYQVVFNANGGDESSVPDPVKTTYGKGLQVPSVEPSYEGHVFAGWAFHPRSPVPLIAPGEYVEADLASEEGAKVTLYAVWASESSTVYWDANAPLGYDVWLEFESSTGGGVAVAPSASCDNHTFLGWYDGPTADAALVVARGGMVDLASWNGRTLYAHWEVYPDDVSVEEPVEYFARWEPVTYSVRFSANGGDAGSVPDAVDVLYGRGWTVPSELPTREQEDDPFAFVGWSLDPSATEAQFAPGERVTMDLSSELNGRVTLYAVWSGQTATVYWDANGRGATVEPAYTTGVGMVAAPTPVWGERVFEGWYDDPSASGELVVAPGGLFDIASWDERTLYAHWVSPQEAYGAEESVALYARWEPLNYYVEFDENGGLGGTAPDPIRVQYGTPWTVPTQGPEREDGSLEFLGWAFDEFATKPLILPGEQVSAPLTEVMESTLTLYAVWGRPQRTVYWDANAPDARVSPGSSSGRTVVAPTPERLGHVFVGWYEADGAEPVAGAGDTLDITSRDGQTLYAHWRPAEYTVAFDANGGDADSVPGQLALRYGEAWSVPTAVPTRGPANGVSYVFEGWSLSPDATEAQLRIGEGTWSLATNDGAELTLYAVWSEVTHTVHWDANGGSVEPASTTGSAFATAPEPVWRGHGFTGWFDESAGLEATRVAGAGDLVDLALYDGKTLRAHWEAQGFTVVFDANRGLSSSVPDGLELVWNGAFDVPATTPTRSGYHFVGWALDPDAAEPLLEAGASYDPAADASYDLLPAEGNVRTLYAVWTGDQATVNWDANGSGAFVNPSSTTGSGMVDAPVPTWAGHTFVGWYDAAQDGNLEVAPNGQADLSGLGARGVGTLFAHWEEDATVDAYRVEGDTDLWARWEPAVYTLAFDANGGSDAPESKTLSYGSAWSVPQTTPVRPDHEFLGWAFGPHSAAALFAPGQQVDMNLTDTAFATVTLYAVWSSEARHTVVWDANAPAGFEASVSPSSTTGSGLRLSPVPTCASRTFVGWYDAPGDGAALVARPGEAVDLSALGNTTLYAHWKTPDEGIVVPDGDTDLYARWEPVRYTVAFDANGGDEGSAPASRGVQYDRTWDVPEAEPTREGYSFVGWALTPNAYVPFLAAGQTCDPAQDAAFNLASEHGATVTLYAVWGEHSTVVWDVNAPKGAVASVEPTSSTGSGLVEAPEPSCSGHTFTGWFDDSKGGSLVALAHDQLNLGVLGSTTLFAHWAPITDELEVTGDTDLYARWEPVRYTVAFDANGGDEGSVPADKGVQYDRAWRVPYVVPAHPQASSGVTFLGWADDPRAGEAQLQAGQELSAEGGACNLSSTNGATVTLYAVWSEPAQQTYTVTWVANGDGATVSPNTTVGTGMEASPVPVWEGHVFQGWYDGAGEGARLVCAPGGMVDLASWDGQSLYARWGDSDTRPVSSSVSYYARWEPACYTVAFDANGGHEASVPDDLVARYGVAWSVPEHKPTRSEHTFVGWALDRRATRALFGAGERVDASLAAEPGAVVTLYAVWTDSDFSVRWDANSPEGATASVSPSVSTGVGLATSPLPMCSGYSFMGWYDGPDGNAEFVVMGGGTIDLASWDGRTLYAHWDKSADAASVSASASYYARWEPVNYNVKFDSNGGDGFDPASITVRYGEAWRLPEAVPTRDDYAFVGWAFDRRATEALFSAGDLVDYDFANVSGASVTLYAVWANGTGTVYWDANAPTGSSASVEPAYSEGMGLVATPVPTCDGHSFEGWYDGPGGKARLVVAPGGLIDIASWDGATLFAHWAVLEDVGSVSARASYYARWEPVTYTVGFDANGGNESVVSAPVAVQYGRAWTVPQVACAQDSLGNCFVGWALDSNASTPLLLPGQTCSVNLSETEGATVTLYAVWADPDNKPVATVTYDANGGTGEMPGQFLAREALRDGTWGSATGRVWENSFERDDRAFVGWNTQADGLGTDYEPYDEIELTDDLTLYAQWTSDVHTVRWDPNGVGATVDPAFSFGSGKVASPVPAREGYRFTGWYTAPGEDGVLTVMPGAYVDLGAWDGATLYAHWEVATDTMAVADDTDLYARWEPVGYRIVFDDNLEDDDVPVPDDLYVQYDHAYTMPDDYLVRPSEGETNYAFLGWSRDPEATEEQFALGETYDPSVDPAYNLIASNDEAADPVVLYAVYAVIGEHPFEVVWDGNGGTSSPSRTRASVVPELPVATRESYEFAGWYTEPVGGTEIHRLNEVEQRVRGHVISTGGFLPLKDQTFYAHWTRAGDTLVVTDDIDLYARWEPAGYYHVVYSIGNGATLDEATREVQADDGTVTTYRVNPRQVSTGEQFYVGVPVSQSGREFKNWTITGMGGLSSQMINGVNSTAKSISGVPGNGGLFRDLSVGDDVVLFTAVWADDDEVKDTLTVSYDANGGSGTVRPQTFRRKLGSDGTYGLATGRVRANAFEREGFVFDTWNTERDGSGKRYPESETGTFDDDTVLYAQWVPDGEEHAYTYQLVYREPDGSGAVVDRPGQSFTYATTGTYDPETVELGVYEGAELSGMAFAGWTTEAPDAACEPLVTLEPGEYEASELDRSGAVDIGGYVRSLYLYPVYDVAAEGPVAVGVGRSYSAGGEAGGLIDGSYALSSDYLQGSVDVSGLDAAGLSSGTPAYAWAWERADGAGGFTAISTGSTSGVGRVRPASGTVRFGLSAAGPLAVAADASSPFGFWRASYAGGYVPVASGQISVTVMTSVDLKSLDGVVRLDEGSGDTIENLSEMPVHLDGVTVAPAGGSGVAFAPYGGAGDGEGAELQVKVGLRGQLDSAFFDMGLPSSGTVTGSSWAATLQGGSAWGMAGTLSRDATAQDGGTLVIDAAGRALRVDSLVGEDAVQVANLSWTFAPGAEGGGT